MKKTVALLAMLTLCSSMAMAQGDLYLNLNDCMQGGAPQHIANPFCIANEYNYNIFGSCIVPTSVPQFVAYEVTLDVHLTSGTLQPWWQLYDGGCRSASFYMTADAWSGGDNCIALLYYLTTPSVAHTSPNMLGPDRLRWNLVVSGDATHPALLPAGPDEMGLFKLTLLATKTVGSDACEGCSQPACIILQEVRLWNVDNSQVRISNPDVGGNNIITYNMVDGAASCQAATPTRNRTWGAIKSLYR